MYIVLIFVQMKPPYPCQCAYLTLLMLYLFLYNAEMDILRRKVYDDVRNIILKHMFVTRSFVFITTSGDIVTIYYCIAFVTKTILHRLYSSTCHERTPSGPGKIVRTLQVAAHRRDGWAAPNVIGPTPYTITSPPAILILNTMSCIVIIMYAIVIEPNINA